MENDCTGLAVQLEKVLWPKEGQAVGTMTVKMGGMDGGREDREKQTCDLFLSL